MADDVLTRTCRLLEDAVQADPGSVTADRLLSTLEGWDSMGVVFFLGEVAALWPGLRIPPEEIERCRTVGDLADLVTRRSG